MNDERARETTGAAPVPRIDARERKRRAVAREIAYILGDPRGRAWFTRWLERAGADSPLNDTSAHIYRAAGRQALGIEMRDEARTHALALLRLAEDEAAERDERAERTRKPRSG